LSSDRISPERARGTSIAALERVRPTFRGIVRLAAPAVLLLTRALSAGAPPERLLRVCADPNALPFSNDRLQGFETQIPERIARRGILPQVVGYPVYGEGSEEDAAARIVRAVETEEVDVAFVWGPLAGYFAKESPVPLDVVPLSPDPTGALPFAFDIALGVRR